MISTFMKTKKFQLSSLEIELVLFFFAFASFGRKRRDKSLFYLGESFFRHFSSLNAVAAWWHGAQEK